MLDGLRGGLKRSEPGAGRGGAVMVGRRREMGRGGREVEEMGERG